MVDHFNHVFLRLPSPISIIHNAPPIREIPEANINHRNFYLDDSKVDIYEPIPVDVIRNIIRNENTPIEEYKEMETLNDAFQVRPAHLPNLSDLFGLSEAFKFYILGLLDKLNESNSNKYLPDHVLNMIDPRPVIN